MISEQQPASRGQFVSFGNIATQDAIRASTWRFFGLPSADVGCLCLRGASKSSGVPFARVVCLRSLICSGPWVRVEGGGLARTLHT